MGQFGEELRRERETRGIALESITDSTKISGRHSMRSNKSSSTGFPAGSSIAASFADTPACGLDEDTWVDRFMSAYQASGMVIPDDADWVKFAENVVNQRPADTDRQTMRCISGRSLSPRHADRGIRVVTYHFVRREGASEHGARSQAPKS